MKSMEKCYEYLRLDGCCYCDTLEEAEHLQRWAVENIKIDPLTKLPVRRVKILNKFFMNEWRKWVSVSY